MPMSPRKPASRDGGARSNIANSSCRHTSPTASSPSVHSSPPRQSMMTTKRIAGSAATIRAPRSERALRRSMRRARRRGWGTSAAPEPAPARRVLLERRLEGLAREVRPQLVAEHELRVRALPQQVVARALLPRGPDDQVGIVHLGRVEELAELVLTAALVADRSVEDLGPPTVVERDEQGDPVVGGRLA